MTSLQSRDSLFDLGHGPKCQKCQQEIGAQPSIEAAGFVWHSQGCFTCSFCSSDITSDFVERHQRVFCVPCERRLFGSYCGEKIGDSSRLGCGELIIDEFVETQERYFHPSCLTCARCQRKSSVAGGLFQYRDQFLCSVCTKAAQRQAN